MIFWNTIMLILDDPRSTDDLSNQFEAYFIGFYIGEMLLKIFGMGFFVAKNSYLRNGWNVLDFFIIVIGIMNAFYSSSGDLRFSVLRIFRVLRPLKTISSLKNLKKIISTLLTAFPMIMNELLIIMFWLMINAIIGVQLFSGILKKRCFSYQTGLMISQNYDTSYNGILCGYASCPTSDLICGKMMDNPNFNITNFDTFLWSLLMMFQGITLENWSVNMYYIARTMSYYTIFFFMSLAFVGSYILMNIFVSIIIKAYKEVENKIGTKIKKVEVDQISINEMKILKIYDQENYRKISQILNFQNDGKDNDKDKENKQNEEHKYHDKEQRNEEQKYHDKDKENKQNEEHKHHEKINPIIKIPIPPIKKIHSPNLKHSIFGHFLQKIPFFHKKEVSQTKDFKKLEKSRKSILIGQIQRLIDSRQSQYENSLIKHSALSHFGKKATKPGQKGDKPINNLLVLDKKVKIKSFEEINAIKPPSALELFDDLESPTIIKPHHNQSKENSIKINESGLTSQMNSSGIMNQSFLIDSVQRIGQALLQEEKVKRMGAKIAPKRNHEYHNTNNNANELQHNNGHIDNNVLKMNFNKNQNQCQNILLNPSDNTKTNELQGNSRKKMISRILSQMLDYKLMVDHNQVFESSSSEDVIPQIKERVALRQKQKIFEEIKTAKNKLEYQLYRIPAKYLKKNFKKSSIGLNLALAKRTSFFLRNMAFSEEIAKNESSGFISPCRNKKKKIKLRLNSFRVSYDYIDFKLSEVLQMENTAEEEEKKFNNEHIYYEIKVFFFF